MRMRFIGMTVVGVLFLGSAFAMEAFEQGDKEVIGRICAQKISEFQTRPEIVEKFFILQSCLGDQFWNAVSDGAFGVAFDAVKPYLRETSTMPSSQDPALTGACKEDRGFQDESVDAAMARQLDLQLNFGGSHVKARVQEIPDAELASRLQQRFYDEERADRERLFAACADAESEPLGVFAPLQKNPRLEEMRGRIAPIFRHIEALPAMGDVHVLDGYVSGNMSDVVEIGRALKMGSPDLSFEKVRIDLKKYFQETPLKLELNGAIIQQETFLGYIDSVFQPDFKSQGLVFQELISRSWSFAIEMRAEEHRRTGKFDDRFLSEIASGIVENYVTGGGCLAGRVNRFFAAYVRMIHYAVNESR